MNKLRLVHASSLAASLAVVFVTVITIWAEQSPALKDSLKAATGHHWVTKSYLTLVIYFLGTLLSYFLIRKTNENTIRSSIYWLVLLTVIGTLTITIYFSWHFASG